MSGGPNRVPPQRALDEDGDDDRVRRSRAARRCELWRRTRSTRTPASGGVTRIARAGPRTREQLGAEYLTRADAMLDKPIVVGRSSCLIAAKKEEPCTSFDV